MPNVECLTECLTREELKEYELRVFALLAPDWSARDFTDIDQDQDGRITTKEFDEHRKKQGTPLSKPKK